MPFPQPRGSFTSTRPRWKTGHRIHDFVRYRVLTILDPAGHGLEKWSDLPADLWRHWRTLPPYER